MMKIQNPEEKPLREIAAQLSHKYPDLVIKKHYFVDSIIVPSGRMKFVLRDRTSFLIADFIPPILLSSLVLIPLVLILPTLITYIYGKTAHGIGRWPWIFLLFIVGRAIYKASKKEQFEQFYRDVEDAIRANPEESNIF